MARKKGDQYKCDNCGLVVIVEDPCGCAEDTCELVCCGEPMEPMEEETEASKKT